MSRSFPRLYSSITAFKSTTSNIIDVPNLTGIKWGLKNLLKALRLTPKYAMASWALYPRLLFALELIDNWANLCKSRNAN